jgi:sialidase-1
MAIDGDLTRRGFLGAALGAPALLAQTVPQAPASSTWNGYEKRDFTLNGNKAYVVLPRIAAAGKPWFWRGRFPDYQTRPALGLLAKGYHLAYLDLPNIFGNPAAVAAWDDFYNHVVLQFGLAHKVSLEGVSRGALFVYNWAAKHAELVDAIYCESPVCDLKSWPGGKGKGLGSAKDWTEAMAAYNLTEEQMMHFDGNPIGKVQFLAARKIPILHVVSDRDQLAPPVENSDIFAERYGALGGPIEVLRNTSLPDTLNGHHFALDDPGRIVNFVLRNTAGMERVAGTGLTPHGHEYFQLRGGLRNAWRKFQAGGSARVAFLGGSITQMAGWRDLVGQQLTARFPQTKFEFINAGISSTGSTPGAFRLGRDVFAKGPVDLLFEEAAVNDSTNFFRPREQVRGMEGIVRHARLLQPELDIVMLHFVDPDKMADLRAGRTPEVIASHERVAAQYDVPSIDLAREITERVDAGEFTWDGDFKNLHPSPFGMSVYARSIERLFDAAWKQPPMIEGPAAPHALPEALDTRSYFRGRLGPVSEAKGWRVVADWTPADKAGTRAGFVHVPMLVSETPGEECRFGFEGSAVGIFVAAGPDAGVVEYQIDGGAWRRQNLFTQWSSGLHIPWAYVLDADLELGRHELAMRVAAEGGGHAVRVVNFLVN